MICGEMIFWTGVATLAMGLWKALACLFAATQKGSCFPRDCLVSDLRLQIVELQGEQVKLQKEIHRLQQGHREVSSECVMRTGVVYVTSTGQCYHTDSKCGHVKDRSIKQLKMCLHSSKKSSHESD